MTRLLRLGEISELRSGVGFPVRLQGRRSGRFPFAKVGDISRSARAGSRSLRDVDYYVEEEDLRELRAKPFPPGTVAFAKIGEAIRQNHRVMLKQPALLDNNVMGATPHDEVVDAQYFYRFLASVDLYPLAQSTTVPSIRKSDLAQIPVPVPSIQEQRRIAAVLDQADDLRAKRTTALALIASFQESIFLDMFGDPARNPYKFSMVPLGELAVKFSDGPFGSNLKSAHYVESGIRVIRLQNIGVGEFLDGDRAFIAEEHFNQLRKHECLPGDVLVGTLGDPNLRACVLPPWLTRSLNKADCVQIRVDPERCTATWLAALLNQPSTERMAQGLVLGQTRARISMGRLRSLAVPVPPVEDQRRFSEVIARAKGLRAGERTSVEGLEELFGSLQRRAFAGQL